ncbi:4959_t:CDS:2, partial [Rhizophagus irregularis]
KKTDYPKSYRARHALSVIHNNNGFVKLQRTVRTAGNLVGFSDQDEKILFNIWKQREQKKEPVNLSKKKYVNGLCALCGYLRKHNLSNHIPNVQYHEQSTSKSSTESMESSKIGSNTLIILKTGGGKSLIYAVASVLS